MATLLAAFSFLSISPRALSTAQRRRAILAGMSEIDRQRVTAVRTLQELGYLFRNGGWVPPTTVGASTAEADRMHALLILRTDQLAGCAPGSPEAADLAVIAEALEAYEAKRWPDGVERGGRR
jgi:hypothetical protein